MVHQGAWHKQQNNTRQLLAHSRHCGGGGDDGWGQGELGEEGGAYRRRGKHFEEKDHRHRQDDELWALFCHTD